MAGRRLQKLGSLIKAELAELILRRVKDPRVKDLSITEVDVSPDLKQAKVYFSLWDEKNQAQAEAGFKAASSFLRGQLASRLRLKTVPRLIPIYDSSLVRGAAMDKLIRRVRAADRAQNQAAQAAQEAEQLMERIADLLDRAREVLLLCHRNPDGDALGACLGLGHILEERGKRVYPYALGDIPPEYDFLPGIQQVSDKLPPAGAVQAAVILDCHQPDRPGPAAASYLEAMAEQVAVVDHHQGQPGFGLLRWVDPEYAATSEMLALLARRAEWRIGPAAATCLFAGIMTDTGSFRYSNTSARVFTTAARLVEAGADPWQVSQEIYATRPRKLRLIAEVMEGLVREREGSLALGQVSRADLESHGCRPQDLENIVELIRGIPGVEAAALLKENPDGSVKVSLRSRGRVDVAALALGLGGGGHKNAAGMTLEGPLPRARKQVLELLRRGLEEAA